MSATYVFSIDTLVHHMDSKVRKSVSDIQQGKKFAGRAFLPTLFWAEISALVSDLNSFTNGIYVYYRYTP